MKNTLFINICLLLTLLCYQAISQKLQEPSEGKSLIYFTRISSAGALINFKFFDGEKYIGKFNGRKYMIYECEPGEHLFWASSENRDFMPAVLKPNRVYIVDAWVKLGGIKARVDLMRIRETDEKSMKKVHKLLSKKPPCVFDEDKLTNEQSEMSEYIQISLEKYEKRLRKKTDQDL